MAQQVPSTSMGRSASSSSLTGESSSAVIGSYGSNLGSNGRGLAAGVRGLSGAITMERSEHERLKYPDRINLDKKGLHTVPILADEPGLRLLSLQHNLIKRIQNLDSIFRLVFLDLYHNRLEQIGNLEPLTNLRVLMLGKNRIRRIEGLQKCTRLSVLDLHGNRITQITGLDSLSELKVLNLAGNQIRKVSNMQGLSSLEELNIRRNRIRSTAGLEVVPTLEKLYMSNNELQIIASLSKLEALPRLQTLQMEGNPVWSCAEYAYYLVGSLAQLKILDQQEISSDLRTNALKWKSSQPPSSTSSVPPALTSSATTASANAIGGSASTASNATNVARRQLMKKMEERNFSISNAKRRWHFLKNQTLKVNKENEEDEEVEVQPHEVAQSPPVTEHQQLAEVRTRPKIINICQEDGEERSDGEHSSSQLTTTETDATLSPTISHLSISRQASRTSLFANNKLFLPDRCKSSPGSPNSGRQSCSGRSGSDSEAKPQLPRINIKNDHIRKRFPGLERRKFALPQKFVSLQSIDLEAQQQMHHHRPTTGGPKGLTSSTGGFGSLEKKIGFFNLPHDNQDNESTSDEFSCGGLLSDSSSDSSSSDSEDHDFPSARQRPMSRGRSHASSNDLERLRRSGRATPTKPGTRLRASATNPDFGNTSSGNTLGGQGNSGTGGNTGSSSSLGTGGVGSTLDRPPIWSRNRITTTVSPLAQQPQTVGVGRAGTPQSGGPGGASIGPNVGTGVSVEVGRTFEQGRDFLIELDGDLLSVYGPQSLKFLDRPWNRHRALKATTVQFNFVSFDDLVPYLSKFRQTFPNVENFEFLETDIHSLDQLNALALVQGMTSILIGEDGNPIYHKQNWRSYAIYRLEHWGLRYVNNAEVTDEDIFEANQAYGSLGELAIMVLPQSQIVPLIRKFELAGPSKEVNVDSTVDIMSTIKDSTVKEIVAKESLHYKPKSRQENAQLMEQNLKALENLMEVGHSAFHKFGRLDDEWINILPILVKRIVSQYSDLRRYKKESLGKLEKM